MKTKAGRYIPTTSMQRIAWRKVFGVSKYTGNTYVSKWIGYYADPKYQRIVVERTLDYDKGIANSIGNIDVLIDGMEGIPDRIMKKEPSDRWWGHKKLVNFLARNL